jgi:hypothetical protein
MSGTGKMFGLNRTGSFFGFCQSSAGAKRAHRGHTVLHPSAPQKWGLA